MHFGVQVKLYKFEWLKKKSTTEIKTNKCKIYEHKNSEDMTEKITWVLFTFDSTVIWD